MAEKRRAHLDSQLWKPPHMRIGKDAWANAAARNASAAGLDVSFSDDWKGLEEGLADAEILICQSKPPVAAIANAPNITAQITQFPLLS